MTGEATGGRRTKPCATRRSEPAMTDSPSELVASLQRALSLANGAGSDKTAFLVELAIASEAMRADEERIDRN